MTVSHNNSTRLLIFIAIGVIAGVTFGWYAPKAAVSIGWLGELFLNALKMTIIPLVIASMITGIGNIGHINKLKKLGGITISYYLITTAIAVLIGLFVVNWIQPGVGVNISHPSGAESFMPKHQTGIHEIVLSLISPNLIAAANHMQLLPLIIFSILLAIALLVVGEKGKPVFNFFDGINEAMMKLVMWVIYFAPIGIFALIAARLGSTGGGEQFLTEIKAVGLHVVTILTGLFIVSIVLLLILLLIARKDLSYVTKMGRALFTAFGTGSSSATLPLTIRCVIDNKVDESTAKFVLPLGATINMNGTALYEAAAAMFIAQAYGIDLSFSQQALIFVTATLAAVGTSGIPEAGLVTMVLVLNAVNLPLEGISLLLAVDWFLDRVRTAVNVWGDAVGAAVIDRIK